MVDRRSRVLGLALTETWPVSRLVKINRTPNLPDTKGESVLHKPLWCEPRQESTELYGIEFSALPPLGTGDVSQVANLVFLFLCLSATPLRSILQKKKKKFPSSLPPPGAHYESDAVLITSHWSTL